jgi:hypothetical protein
MPPTTTPPQASNGTPFQAPTKRIAWILLLGLAALGILDTFLRYYYLLPDKAVAWRDILNDPGKQLFVVLFLPLLAFLVARHYPVTQARAAFQRHSLLFGTLASILTFGIGAYYIPKNAVNNFYLNCTTPEHIGDEAIRTNIAKIRETHFQAVVNALGQPNYAAHAEIQMLTFETNRNQVFSDRGLTNHSLAGFWHDTSRHAKVAVLETEAAVFIGLTILWTLLLFTPKGSQTDERTKIPKETSDAILLAVALLSLWVPLKLYSEWYTNFCHAREGQHLNALFGALIGLFVLFVITFIVKASEPVRGWVCKGIAGLGILCQVIFMFPEANNTLNTIARGIYTRVGAGELALVFSCAVVVLLVAFVLGFSSLIPGEDPPNKKPEPPPQPDRQQATVSDEHGSRPTPKPSSRKKQRP